MHIRRFEFLSLFLLVGVTANPQSAAAQPRALYCVEELGRQIPPALNERAFKKLISLERQYLTYCKEFMQPDDYTDHLADLAIGLNSDNQYQEALGVVDRCLQINAAHLECLFLKSDALSHLGHLVEAKSLIKKSLAVGAIKRALQNLLTQVNMALDTRTAERTPNTRNQTGTTSRQADRGKPAKVTGSVSCSGDAVGVSIDIDGEIDSGTVESVGRLFDNYHQRKCDDDNAFGALGDHYGINSPGGSVPAAMAIGRMFRKEHAWLGVDGACISACVLILAGAVDRQIGGTAVVGIHRPYFATTPQQRMTPDQVRDAYARMLQDIRAYLREMDVPERLADEMLATEPERVHVLTLAELTTYGLARIDSAEQRRRAIENEARDVQEANQLGVDRREYTRRKSLGINACIFNSMTGKYMSDGEMFDCRRRILTTGR
jgi:ATP-dependent protease ClpP protease subunit